MEFKKAAKTAMASGNVKKIFEQGYYLNSGISVMQPEDDVPAVWMLTFYNKEKDLVEVVDVDGNEVITNPTAKPIKPTVTPLDLKKIKTNSDKMLVKATKEFKKLGKPLSQVIVTVQSEGERQFWSFNFVLKTLEITIIKIDCSDGKILGAETKSLVQK